MKIITKIFPNGGYYISSGWGKRRFWYNKEKRWVEDFHNGIDYATYGKKLPQYAVEDGYIIKSAKASDGANYIWVAYPRLGKKFLHYHLDSRSVVTGQKVKAGTLLGYTGMTGFATGIHLHLGMKNINGGDYESVEEYNYIEPSKDKFAGVSDEELARRVWAGEFGSGDERKIKLGSRYSAVQDLVNKGVGKPQPKSESLKVGDIVVPTKLVDYKGHNLKQYDSKYQILSIDSRGAVLGAIRGNERPIWAILPLKNIKKV